MEYSKRFRVAVVANLSDREWQILATASRLTTARERNYRFEPPTEEPADIYLVEGEQGEKQDLWAQIHAQHPSPVIFLMSEPDEAPGRWKFPRPLTPSCLLSLVNLLDEVTVQELHYLPELSIGQEGEYSIQPDTISSRGASFTALVVDDSTTVQAQVGIGLKMFGVSADYAGTAEEAFKLLDNNSYDIAFLDVVLPGGADGYQICRKIKKNPHSKETTVIMLTGKSSTFDRVKASMAGCDAYLTKPVQNEVFQETLRQYLQEPNEMRAKNPVA